MNGVPLFRKRLTIERTGDVYPAAVAVLERVTFHPAQQRAELTLAWYRTAQALERGLDPVDRWDFTVSNWTEDKPVLRVPTKDEVTAGADPDELVADVTTIRHPDYADYFGNLLRAGTDPATAAARFLRTRPELEGATPV